MIKVSIMIFYKLKNKKYRDSDYVKDCTLTNIELDKNFYELEGKDVKASYRDEKDSTTLVIELYDGTKIRAVGVLSDASTEFYGGTGINVKKTPDGDYIIGLEIEEDSKRKGLYVDEADNKLKINIASHEQFGTVKLGVPDTSTDGNEFEAYKDATTDVVTVNIHNASETRNGLMSSEDYEKLSGVEEGAERNTIVGIKVNGEVVDVDSDRYANITSTRFFETVKEEGESDEQAIERALGGTEARNGFFCVLKTNIADDKYSYTAFVFDGETSLWKAMDGNYDADNVYFRDNIIAAGDYTQVGNITKERTGAKEIASSGKSVKDLFNEIFTKRLQPTATQPTISISIANSGEYETGTVVVPAYSVSTTPGSYTYGPATGVVFSNFVVTNNKGEESSETTGVFEPYTINDNSNMYSAFVTASHSDGVVANDNIGDPSDPEVRIQAGTKQASKNNAYSGFRKYFVGIAGTSVDDIDSSFIRGLQKSGKMTTSMISYSFPYSENNRVVYICVPSTYRLSKVIDVKAARTEITGVFVEDAETVTVYGATEGLNPMEYRVYRYASQTVLNDNTYEITLSNN